MTLQIVNEENIVNRPILNLKHFLDTNTGNVKVSTTYSKNSPDNNITIATNYSVIKQRVNTGSLYEVKAYVRTSAKTMKKCLTLGQECVTLLNDNMDELEAYNMTVKTRPIASTPIPIEKNANTKIYVQQIIVSYRVTT